MAPSKKVIMISFDFDLNNFYSAKYVNILLSNDFPRRESPTAWKTSRTTSSWGEKIMVEAKRQVLNLSLKEAMVGSVTYW